MNARSLITATASVAVAGLLVVTNGSVSSAAPKESKLTVVMYSETVGFHSVDGSAPGIDHGDLFHRELALSRTQGGPVVGVGYSQAEVISHSVADDVDVRRVIIEDRLPKGQLFMMGLTELKRGTTPQPGWTDTYAVVGGTGRYAGARGTQSLLLLPDGKTFKVTWRLTVE